MNETTTFHNFNHSFLFQVSKCFHRESWILISFIISIKYTFLRLVVNESPVFYFSFLSPRHLMMAALHMISVTEQMLLQVPLEKNLQNVQPIPVPGHILAITVLHSMFSVMKLVTFVMSVVFEFWVSLLCLNSKSLFIKPEFRFSILLFWLLVGNDGWLSSIFLLKIVARNVWRNLMGSSWISKGFVSLT